MRVAEVELALDHVLPVRRVGILEVREPHARARVERVDRHLDLGRAGDLDAAVLQRLGHRVDHPVALPHAHGLRIEVDRAGGGDLLAAHGALCQEGVAARLVLRVERGDQLERLGREDLVEAGQDRAGDGELRHVVRDSF